VLAILGYILISYNLSCRVIIIVLEGGALGGGGGGPESFFFSPLAV